MHDRDADTARCPIPAVCAVFDLVGSAAVGSHDPQRIGTVLICDPGSIRRPPRSGRTRPGKDTRVAGDVHTVRCDVRDRGRGRRSNLHEGRPGPARPGADHDRDSRHEHEHSNARPAPPPYPARTFVQRRDWGRLNGWFGDEPRDAPVELWKLRHRARPPRRGIGKRSMGVRKRRRHGATRDSHRACDLLLRQVPDVPQCNRRALAYRQGGDDEPDLHHRWREGGRATRLPEKFSLTSGTALTTAQHVQRHPIRPTRRRTHRPHPRPTLQRPRTCLVHGVTTQVHVAGDQRQRRHETRMHLPVPRLEIDLAVHQPIKSRDRRNAG